MLLVVLAFVCGLALGFIIWWRLGKLDIPECAGTLIRATDEDGTYLYLKLDEDGMASIKNSDIVTFRVETKQ